MSGSTVRKSFGLKASCRIRITVNADAELEPFIQLIEALEPWLEEVVLIGGWAHRLYRLDSRAQGLAYPPLTTLDSDVASPSKIEAKETSIRTTRFAKQCKWSSVGNSTLKH